MAVGEDAKVDVANDGFYDVYVLLNSIVNNKANVTIQKIHEEIPEEKQDSAVDTSGEVKGKEVSNENRTEKKSFTWLWVLIIVILIGIFSWWFMIRKKKK